MNAVVILFITDVDELTFDIIEVINPRLIEYMSRKGNPVHQGDEDSTAGGRRSSLRRQDKEDDEGDAVGMTVLRENIARLEEQNDLLREQFEELKRRIAPAPQDEGAAGSGDAGGAPASGAGDASASDEERPSKVLILD